MINRNNRPILTILFILLTPCLILFFIDKPGTNQSRSFEELWNLGHVVSFFIFSLIIIIFKSRSTAPSFGKSFSSIMLLVLILGGTVELIQFFTGRTTSLGDILRNLTGAAAASIFFSPERNTLTPKMMRALKTSCLAALIACTYPLIIAATDEFSAKMNFPVLSDFSTILEVSRWDGNADFSIQSYPSEPENKSLRVNLTRDQYSGVYLQYFPGNWSGYNSFSFSIFNDSGKNVSLSCRINDIHHVNNGQEYNDRFNRSYNLKPGPNEFSIPVEDIEYAPQNRKMDMENICLIIFFSTKTMGDETLYIDDVVLAQ